MNLPKVLFANNRTIVGRRQRGEPAFRSARTSTEGIGQRIGPIPEMPKVRDMQLDASLLVR